MTKRSLTVVAPPTSPSPTVPPRPARKSTDAARHFAIAAAQMLADDKCEDVVVLDVSGISPVSDFIVIGSGSSERQMRSVLSHVEDMGRETGFSPFHSSDDDRATWLLADFVDVVVHLFEPNTRAHYDLEMLWGDAARVAWERAPGSRAPTRPARTTPRPA